MADATSVAGDHADDNSANECCARQQAQGEIHPWTLEFTDATAQIDFAIIGLNCPAARKARMK